MTWERVVKALQSHFNEHGHSYIGVIINGATLANLEKGQSFRGGILVDVVRDVAYNTHVAVLRYAQEEEAAPESNSWQDRKDLA